MPRLITLCSLLSLAILAACDAPPVTVADARKRLLGEWTAPPTQQGTEPSDFWEYLRFNADGTVVHCVALGSEDSWGDCDHDGPPSGIAYQVTKQRYADTGADYIEIRIPFPHGGGGLSEVRYIVDGAQLQQRVTRDMGASFFRAPDFRRGNLHPHAPSPR